MKSTHTLVLVLAGLTIALVAGAVTPKPASSPKPTAAGTPAPSPKVSASPAEVLPSPREQVATANTAVIQSNQPPPKPVLFLLRTEAYSTGGKNWIRYRYDVANKADYPADMFAAAPSLPPCGSNPNSSRTWVDFFDSTGKRLYGFCALGKPADLGLLWFAVEEGVVPPSYVYIELNDRQTNTKYKSNLADTTL
jgi:hypothetical protein